MLGTHLNHGAQLICIDFTHIQLVNGSRITFLHIVGKGAIATTEKKRKIRIISCSYTRDLIELVERSKKVPFHKWLISKIEGANEAKKSRWQNSPTCTNYERFFRPIARLNTFFEKSTIFGKKCYKLFVGERTVLWEGGAFVKKNL